MKVVFYPDCIESGVYEVPDNITEEALYDWACEWVAENVSGFWKIIEE